MFQLYSNSLSHWAEGVIGDLSASGEWTPGRPAEFAGIYTYMEYRSCFRKQRLTQVTAHRMGHCQHRALSSSGADNTMKKLSQVSVQIPAGAQKLKVRDVRRTFQVRIAPPFQSESKICPAILFSAMHLIIRQGTKGLLGNQDQRYGKTWQAHRFVSERTSGHNVFRDTMTVRKDKENKDKGVEVASGSKGMVT